MKRIAQKAILFFMRSHHAEFISASIRLDSDKFRMTKEETLT